MIILTPTEYYVNVKQASLEELAIEDRNLDYNINLYRESTGNNNQISDKFKPIIDLESVYRRDFFDELDNEYAKNAVKQNKAIS